MYKLIDIGGGAGGVGRGGGRSVSYELNLYATYLLTKPLCYRLWSGRWRAWRRRGCCACGSRRAMRRTSGTAYVSYADVC